MLDNQVPLARTNVAQAGVAEVGIDAFSFTIPASNRASAAPTFITSVVPEVRNMRTQPEAVAPGDVSPAGLRLKTEFVLNVLDDIMRQLDVRWADATGIQLYTVHDLQPLLAEVILPRLGLARRWGIDWHHALPPAVGAELEIGVRGIRVESVV